MPILKWMIFFLSCVTIILVYVSLDSILLLCSILLLTFSFERSPTCLTPCTCIYFSFFCTNYHSNFHKFTAPSSRQQWEACPAHWCCNQQRLLQHIRVLNTQVLREAGGFSVECKGWHQTNMTWNCEPRLTRSIEPITWAKIATSGKLSSMRWSRNLCL